MKKVLFIALGLMFMIGVMGAGCGKKAAEKTAEKALETATNGQADVDYGTNTVTVNTNEGGWQTGENVKLPDNFPSDVHVIDGTLFSTSHFDENEGFTASIKTTKSVAEAKAEYDRELVADGWTETMSWDYEGSASLAAEKGNRTITISIIKDQTENSTMVSVSTSTNP